jgi:hypothetical protein
MRPSRSLMETLSHKQKIVLSILRAQIETKGYPPSVRELAQALDTTVSTAHYHLVRLRKRGQPIPKSVKLALLRRSQGYCEIMLPGCTVFGSDPHHRKLRSRGGSNTLDNLLLACRPCHDRITAMAVGTERFRTHSWQAEGVGEDCVVWQPQDRARLF